MNADWIGLIPIGAGVVGLGVAYLIYRALKQSPAGTAEVQEIGQQIRDGAMVFLRREYTWLALFSTIVLVALLIFLGPKTALAFFLGAVCSAAAGWLGMNAATVANVRTATAANIGGTAPALTVAFYGGSVMGLCVASLGVIGLGLLYQLFGGDAETAHAIHGFGMGGSCVALFSRVGGGIFTKSADVGADLVGKVEQGIPEDDPRNPGVIADAVGDNVGDIAGMGSDIFESYTGSMIATMAIAAAGAGTVASLAAAKVVLPLLLTSSGLLAAIVFIGVVRLRSGTNPSAALRTATIGAPLLFLVFSLIIVQLLSLPLNIFYSIVCGAIGGVAIGLITEYYTAGKPIVQVASAGETGPATVMIAGLAKGMESVVLPVLVLATIILISTWFSGLYGVGIAAVGMLATVGITMAIDAYGPVADNAGGIAEMADMGEETRRVTDGLDELGNTTAAIGKGFAIGAAALAALAIIAAFVETVRQANPGFTLNISDPLVLVGMFIGGVVPFAIASITMTAVGEAAFEMINEIRRQFREIEGLMEGKAKPDTAKCVDIATTAALKRMVLPAALAVCVPPLVGFTLGPQALGGLLGGGLLTCVLLALMMANAGGIWDNAKKYVEKGNLGGKGSATHSAVVVGDTVGDPFKDTSGPSMNILINVMAIVSLVIAPLL